MRKDIQNEDLHLFASNLIENRVSFTHLPNDFPKDNILSLPRSQFCFNASERKKYAESAKVFCACLTRLTTFLVLYNTIFITTISRVFQIYCNSICSLNLHEICHIQVIYGMVWFVFK